MEVILTKQALSDIETWLHTDVKVLKKVLKLLKEIAKTPFEGIGKPEPLKHELSGCWSRRITDEHRIVYELTENGIIIHSCLGHYEA
ncbi:MAG: Txe/YoeB family addiction module toxin [Bacteroidia bacterium]